MKDLETMQREGREGFKQDFTSDCEGYIDCIKGQLDKLDQHTANTWKACKDAILESGLLEEKIVNICGYNFRGVTVETESAVEIINAFEKKGHNTLARDIKEFISSMDKV